MAVRTFTNPEHPLMPRDSGGVSGDESGDLGCRSPDLGVLSSENSSGRFIIDHHISVLMLIANRYE